jgi:fumarate reductase subunit D
MSATIFQRAAHRSHPAYWAFVVHRVSGVALALFLPLHFLTLGLALNGAAALDGALAWTSQPLVKLGEWLVVSALALHMMGGLRLLFVELLAWSDQQRNWIAVTSGIGIAVGLLFAFNALGM